MDEVCSDACPSMAGSASIAVMREASRSLVRWIVLGAASLVLFILAAAHGASVGAAAPAPYTGNYCINFYTCYSVPTNTPTYVAPTYVAPAAVAAPATTSTTGYPPNTVISTYADPRYCGGVVSVVTDSSGNLIDVCPGTGQRIAPIYPDYVNGFAPGFLGANYLNGNIAFNGNFNYLNGNVCTVNFNCGAFNTFPAGGTVVGGVVYYNDNRFCGDGKIAFVPGRGYFCQNGGPLMPNGVTTVNCGNFFLNGCGIWRGYEADAPAAPAAATQPQQVTTYAAPAAKAPVVAPAAPVVAPAAPVVAPAAPVIAPAAVAAPAAPVVAPAAPVSAKTATALNAPVYVPVGSTSDPTDRG
jgi:hypothetical protein